MKISLLKQRDFLLLMLGKLVSLIGSQMQSFALSLYVFKITGSATKFASIFAVMLIPEIILGPIAGVLADWFDRKKIIVFFDLFRGAIIGVYAILFLMNGKLSMLSIYILVIILSIASLIFQPAVSTVIPSIIKKEDLVDANGINTLIMNVGVFISPGIAGFLFGIYGIGIILVLNSVSFIVSAVSEIFIRIPKTNKKPDKISFKSFRIDFAEGFKFIINKKIILTIIMLGFVVNFAFNPLFSVGIIYISKSVLKVSDFLYGTLQSILVISMFIAPFLCSYISKKIKLGKLLFFDIFFVSFLIAIMSIIPSSKFLGLFSGNIIPFVSLIVITFTICVIIGVGNISIGTMIQSEVPIHMMGRVSTVMNTGLLAASPIGQMVFGVLYDKIDTWICVFIVFVILFVAIMLFRNTLCSCEN